MPYFYCKKEHLKEMVQITEDNENKCHNFLNNQSFILKKGDYICRDSEGHYSSVSKNDVETNYVIFKGEE